ncbi:MAG: hydrogenase maturation nickel metallochaperone HypA [Planctomycetes bacterium]|nr:hydrogenase maturation nickel metallochaperone HypA [Planctomycetota bacterium]
MHESSLARRILDLALERALAADATRLVRVTGWVAETESLSANSLALHFGLAARGTLAEGARLDIRTERVAARCSACGTSYEPEHHVLVCPCCAASGAELLGRTGFGVESIEVE